MSLRVANPPNPWASSHTEWLEEPPLAPLEIYLERARSILSENDSPDIPFRWSVNPYRGCQHACAYCYARPTHQYLSFGAGTDFERKIVVKENAPELLRLAFRKRTWQREEVVFSGNTDCYQPLEAVYELTRRCLETALAFRNPVAIITKAALVRRDAELLAELARVAGARVLVSIAFADDTLARAVEPAVSAPSKRFAALRALSDAGVPTAVAFAPLIPGLNEDQIPAVLSRAREAGAQGAFLGLLRLPAETRAVFEERVATALPLRAKRIRHALEEMRAEQPRPSDFGVRMRGSGARWEALARLFELQCRRLGLTTRAEVGAPPPPRPRQAWLFEP